MGMKYFFFEKMKKNCFLVFSFAFAKFSIDPFKFDDFVCEFTPTGGIF